MNEEQIERIKNSVREVMQLIAQRGRPLSNELKLQLARVIEHAAERIQEIRGAPPEAPQQAPIPDNAQLLWVLSGGQPNAFVSYLREFPDPTLASIVSNPTRLAQTIEELQRNNPIERTGQADGVPQAQLQSSNVYGFKFNPKDKKLKVRFQGGSVYEYDNVPEVIFNLFAHGNAHARTTGKNRYGAWWRGKNPSLGAALNQYIKEGGYPYRKIK